MKMSCWSADGPEAAEEDEERQEEGKTAVPSEEDGTDMQDSPHYMATQPFCVCVCAHAQENQERAKKNRDQQRERELQFRKQQREQADHGARPFFLKNCKNVCSLCSASPSHCSIALISYCNSVRNPEHEWETLHLLCASAAEKKKLQLAEKYEQLKKSGKLENFLSKKRKRNTTKDRRKLPGKQSRKKT